MTCPLCSRRPVRRACPALGHDICPTCCATKRLGEIRCTPDCRYLSSSREHPAAVVRRQQEADIARLIVSMGRPLTEAQLQLFFLIASVIVRHRPDGIVSLADADVADAAGAMAATLEAATRGVIAQVPGANPVSEGLRRQVDGMLAEVGRDAGARFAAEAALVLRGVERGAGHQDGAGAGPEDYLTLLKRVLPPLPEAPPADPPPAIILP